MDLIITCGALKQWVPQETPVVQSLSVWYLYKITDALDVSSLVQNTAYFFSNILSKWLPGSGFIHSQDLVMA